METHPYFTKIGANGEVLPREATEWEAVLDSRTGLMWAVKELKVTSQKKAEAAAKQCTMNHHYEQPEGIWPAS